MCGFLAKEKEAYVLSTFSCKILSLSLYYNHHETNISHKYLLLLQHSPLS